MNLSINRVIMPHTRVVLFTHSLILLKGYVIMLKSFGLHHAIMLNICVVLSKQCLIMLKGYVIMLRNPVILFMKHVNLSENVLLC